MAEERVLAGRGTFAGGRKAGGQRVLYPNSVGLGTCANWGAHLGFTLATLLQYPAGTLGAPDAALEPASALLAVVALVVEHMPEVEWTVQRLWISGDGDRPDCTLENTAEPLKASGTCQMTWVHQIKMRSRQI